MLKTTKATALMILLMLSVIIAACGDAYAATKTRQPQREIVQKTPAPATLDKTFTRKATAFLVDPRWRHGAKYNGSQKPRLSKYGCVGCCAYAADFVAYVFGKGSPRSGTEFRSLSQVRAGDILVLSGPPHWIIVLSRNGNRLTTAEGNWMGKVFTSKEVYTINGKNIMRNGKKFRTFSLGYHYM